jgi:LPXTG-motif cell wall-anchored protein
METLGIIMLIAGVLLLALGIFVFKDKKGNQVNQQETDHHYVSPR